MTVNVFIIAAISVDGFISPVTSVSSIQWTSKGDKQFFGDRTKEAKVMVMGSTTFATIGRPLKDRLIVVMSSKPAPIEYSQLDPAQVRFTSDSPVEILHQLEEEKYQEVAICGGSSVYTQFMELGLVNTLYLTVEPIVFGKGIPLFNKELGARKLSLAEFKKIDNDTILLKYSVEGDQ